MNKSFTFRSLLAVAAVSGVADSTASAACWYPDEIVADQVKDFQYMLMVGALQCRTVSGMGSEAYNDFVAQKRGVLDSKGYVLKGHFLRENGVQGGRAAYDEHNTAMSNHQAGRADDASFCSTIAAYTRMAATSSDRDFVLLAQSVVEPPVSTCGAGTRVAAAAPPPLPPALWRSEPVAPPPVAYAQNSADDDPYAPGREVIAAPVAVAPPYEAGPVVPYAEPVAYPERVPAAEPVYAGARVDAGIVVDPEVIAPPARESAFTEPEPEPTPEPPVADGYPTPPPMIHPVARAVPARAVAAGTAPAPAVKPVAARTSLPTKVIAAAPVVPPGEVQSPAAALQAAIAALQAATEALKAQQLASAGPAS